MLGQRGRCSLARQSPCAQGRDRDRVWLAIPSCPTLPLPPPHLRPMHLLTHHSGHLHYPTLRASHHHPLRILGNARKAQLVVVHREVLDSIHFDTPNKNCPVFVERVPSYLLISPPLFSLHHRTAAPRSTTRTPTRLVFFVRSSESHSKFLARGQFPYLSLDIVVFSFSLFLPPSWDRSIFVLFEISLPLYLGVMTVPPMQRTTFHDMEAYILGLPFMVIQFLVSDQQALSFDDGELCFNQDEFFLPLAQFYRTLLHCSV